MSITGPMNGCGSANGWSTMSRSISLRDRLEQRAFLAVLDDQPPRRGAALAGRQIGRLDDDRRRRLACPWRPTRPADCCRPARARGSCAGSRRTGGERHAGARRSGEQQAVDARLGGQRAALVRAADQQAHDAFGNARGMEAFDQEGAGRRGLLGRLEDHRIAGDQRRDDVAVGQVRGEIIGAEHRQHAMRLVADRDLVAERRLELPLRRALGIGVDRNLDLVDDRARLRSSLPTTACRFRAR